MSSFVESLIYERCVLIGALLLVGYSTIPSTVVAAENQPHAAADGTDSSAKQYPPIQSLNPPEKDFFAKQLSYQGLPIKSSQQVVDEALHEAYDRLDAMLQHLPTTAKRLVATRVELHIIGRNEVTTDLPECRHDKGRPLQEYNGLTRDQRTRGMGGRLVSCGEENLLRLRQDRYRGSDICVHEFAHAIRNFGMTRPQRALFDAQYKRSLAAGRWNKSYAGSNTDEFFAELSMWYFGTHGSLGMQGEKPADGPEGLKAYDPEAYSLFDAFYSGELEATAAPATKETKRIYLSGVDAASAVPWNFLCTTGRRSGEWTTIPVPSLWDVQGFGTIHYGHDRPSQLREQGLYRHRFVSPDRSNNQRIFLVFGGSMTDTQATLNSHSVGPVHRGAFYEFRYEVTDLLQDQQPNLLEVQVSKESEDPSVNEAERRADYWVFGGIFRPVWLESVPAEFIESVAIDAKADGTIRAEASINCLKATTATVIEMEVVDPAGHTVAKSRSDIPDVADTSRVAALSAEVKEVRTWTAETPTLYTVRFRLLAGERVLHTTTERVGFRTIEVRPGEGIFVNGHRVTLKGINRHSFRPESGRSLSRAQNREDAELLKQMNLNAVRMSHYPPDPSFLEAADELGLYVIDELSGWQAHYSTEAGRPLVREMVVRDRNHPSILFWSNGNEGGWNSELDDDFARWDLQDRPLLHTFPGFHRGRTVFRGVNTRHYPTYDQLVQSLAGDDLVMPTEYLHGLYDGGHGAGLRDFWNAITSSPVGAGGFLWVLADEGVARSNEQGNQYIDVATNLAPDGIVGPHHEREASYYTAQRIFAPVQFDATLPSPFTGELPLRNAYDFLNLNELEFHWQLLQFPEPTFTATQPNVIATGQAKSPNIAAGESGTLQLPVASYDDIDALAVSAIDPHGMEVGRWVWALRDLRPELPEADATENASILISGDVKLAVDSHPGTIRTIHIGDHTIPLTNGPRLAIGQATQQPTTSSSLTAVEWSAASKGWFRLKYEFDAEGPATFAGVTFDLPADQVRSSRWLGVGPYRVWQNRLEGGTLGVWHLDANDTITGWRDWQYPEFRGFYAGGRWMTLELNDGHRITIVPEDPDLYVQRLSPSLPPRSLQADTEVELPDGDLSLLHVIPAIGTKFNAAPKLGPQSQPAQLQGTYSGTVWFHFE
ncbi:glycoside hydrolase family 2 TIM barrel-domain containing protein [Aeoliella mucimassa]|uniref:beta-galactosidase n=1 Tax=Aeoliella mucimassa TaxID=2527972 RepID=A0A518APG3_9BACT|nr:glycoside hydrolase family 2 TIM barrel-domain containing protein [Aeoliella mucimassa]QDU56619.1 Beta-galactosidase [Aeoliella mucimassa]